jgi:hypothetical protein
VGQAELQSTAKAPMKSAQRTAQRTELTGNEVVSRNASWKPQCIMAAHQTTPVCRPVIAENSFSITDWTACTLLALNQSNGTANSKDTN